MIELWNTYGIPLAVMLGWIGLTIGIVMLAVAYLTYFERKILANVFKQIV